MNTCSRWFTEQQQDWLTFPTQGQRAWRANFALQGHFTLGGSDNSLGNYFMEMVKDNVGFFHLITSEIITWQSSKQLEPVVIIYYRHLIGATLQEILQNINLYLSLTPIPNILL